MSLKHSILALIIAALAGCSHDQRINSAYKGVPNNWNTKVENLIVESNHAKTIKSSPYWWQAFADDNIDKLVEITLEQNLDLKTAQARILEARGLSMQANSSFFPHIEGSASLNKGNQGIITQNKFQSYKQAKFDASYELDLFGRNRAIASSADAFESEQINQYNYIKISMIAEAIKVYLTVVSLQQQIECLSQITSAYNNTSDLIQSHYDSGTVNESELNKINSAFKLSEKNLADLKIEYENNLSQLYILLGEYPGGIKIEKSALPTLDLNILLDAPINILLQRPDVLAAQDRLIKAGYDQYAAFTQLLPTISISGMLGVQDSNLFKKKRIWSFTPGIILPLLNFGLIQGQIQEAEAQEQQAYWQFKKIIISAVNEIEAAIKSYFQARNGAYYTQESLQKFKKNLAIRQNHYEKGIASNLEVLDAKITCLNAQMAFIQAKTYELISAIAVYKALAL